MKLRRLLVKLVESEYRAELLVSPVKLSLYQESNPFERTLVIARSFFDGLDVH